MNKFPLIILLFFGNYCNFNLFISADEIEEVKKIQDNLKFVLGEIEKQIFKQNKQILALTQKFENRLDDLDKKITILTTNNSPLLSPNTDQQCCKNIENVSKVIENVEMKIDENDNKITSLTRNLDDHKIQLNNFRVERSLNEELLKQISEKINIFENDQLENIKKLNNDIKVISKNVINLSNSDIIPSFNKIVTESIKNVIQNQSTKLNEFDTKLTKIELNQNKANTISEQILKQNLDILSDNVNIKSMINNITTTQINTLKDDFKSQLSEIAIQMKSTGSLFGEKSKEIFNVKNVVDDILVKIKDIENSFNKFVIKNEIRSKDELIDEDKDYKVVDSSGYSGDSKGYSDEYSSDGYSGSGYLPEAFANETYEFVGKSVL